jgi:hypothetical protein
MISYLLIGLTFIISFSIFMWEITKKYRRKLKSKTWQVGDKIITGRGYISLSLSQVLGVSDNMVTLVGWNPTNVIYRYKNVNYIESWSSVKTNKSDYWRKHYESSEKFMGKKPDFNIIVSDKKTEISGDLAYGEPIETLTETLCEIYLKQALKDENYELADKIRKRMEKFR